MKKTIFFLLCTLSIIIGRSQYFDFARCIQSPTYSQGEGLDLDNAGNIYTVGSFTGTTDFDPGPGTFNYTAINEDAYIQKLDANGDFIWAKSISGVAQQRCRSIATDDAGNVYIIGYYHLTADFDPGPGVQNVTSMGSLDIFVLKLDPNGNFIWVKSIGSNGQDMGVSILTDHSGNVYVSGTFQGTVDLNPGLGVNNVSSYGSDDLFIIKLDSNGSFIWSRQMGGGYTDVVSPLHLDAQGNIFCTGKFLSGIDLNPLGMGGYVTGGASNDNIFILKIDTANTFIWAKSMGGPGDAWGNSITADLNGNVFLTGGFMGTNDFFPGPGTINFTAVGYVDVFVQKLTSTGNYLWTKTFGGTSADQGYSIATDTLGNVYTAGAFIFTVDFNPGAGINNMISNGSSDAFFQKLDPSGNYIWSKSFGGTYDEIIMYMKLDSAGSIYSSGRFTDGTVDFDPGPGTYNLTAVMVDAFVQKLTQDSCSNLGLVLDSLSNVICTDSGYISIHAINEITPVSYLWDNPGIDLDSILEPDTAGIYTITLTDGYQCERTTSYLIGSPLNITSFNLNTNIATTAFRPGANTNIWLNGYNDGCVPVSGQMKFRLDPLVNYNFANPPPDYISGDTLIWDFPSITSDSWHLSKQIHVTTDSTAVIGNHIYFDLIITPIIGDADTNNNHKEYIFNVVNSYDPNDKKVYPSGECFAGYILPNQNLTYTVRFQNTGNSDAINIYILDSLDTNLNLNSVRVIGSSHPVITEVLTGNILKFIFDNIMLPDSGSNEIGSHGYVIFDIMPDTGLTVGISIENSSKIYFDYNPAVITNTVTNTITNSFPNITHTMELSACGSGSIIINGYTYSLSGSYIQHLGNNLGCDSVLSLNLTIIPLDVSISAVGNILSSNQSFGIYQWIDCNNSNQPIAGETNQSFTATANGNYAVIVTNNGCMDTSACQAIFGFGIESNHFNNGISISPNPTHSTVTISSLVELKSAAIQVTNIDGQVLLQRNQIIGKNYLLDLNELSAGMYFIHIYSEGKKAILKVVKN